MSYADAGQDAEDSSMPSSLSCYWLRLGLLDSEDAPQAGDEGSLTLLVRIANL